MADAHSEVDERLPFPCLIPAVHIGSAAFQLERGCHAVVCLKLIISRLLPVLMQIDEPRRDDESLRVDHLFTLQRFSGDRANLAAANSDFSYGIQARLRIHDPSIGDDHVVGLVCGRRTFHRTNAEIDGEQSHWYKRKPELQLFASN